jgi:hypothetical protein
MNFIPLSLVLFILIVAPRHTQAALQTFDDKTAFVTATGASSASGPLPDLGQVGDSVMVGTVTFSLAPGGDTLAIGASGTPAEPDWYPLTAGNDIALGFENLQVQTATPVFALGFDFVEPDSTMPDFGGTPVDSTFEVVLFAEDTEVDRFTFNAPDDELAFVGVWSDTPFDRVTIIDLTGDHDDEFFGEFYSAAIPPPCAAETLCTVEDQEMFLAATAATAATGVDADGEPLPLPDLGKVKDSVTIGEATFEGKKLFVGAGGDSTVVNGDWTPLLPGPDIALTGNGPKKQLDVYFAEPVFAAGFDYVELENSPNVGQQFSDATFTVTLRRGKSVIAETSFNAPNDVAAFVGLWADVAFDRLELRTLKGAGTKVLGKVYAGFIPGFSHRGNILVVDSGSGTGGKGRLFEVNRGSGSRTVLSDFGDGSLGQPGQAPFGVAAEASGHILVVDFHAGTNNRGALFRVDPKTETRTILSDFGNPGQGPLGDDPVDVAVEASGHILVIDEDAGRNEKGALFRVNPVTGNRTMLSDFGQGQRPGSQPNEVAVEASGQILVVDLDAGTNNRGALFRVNSASGNRTLLSDFGDSAQGALGYFLVGVAVEASGQILVIDNLGGTNGKGALFRVHPTTGFRTLLNDFGSTAQGQALGGALVGVAVEASGQILVLDSIAGIRTGGDGALFRVNPTTGFRTLFSDFGDVGQGPRGFLLQDVAIRR